MGIIQNNQIRQFFKELSENSLGELFSYIDLADMVEQWKPSIKPSKQQLVRLSMEFNVRRVKVNYRGECTTKIAFYPRGVDVGKVD